MPRLVVFRPVVPRLVVFRPVASVFVSGCHAYTPPPVVARNRGPAPMPEGSVMVTLAVGIEPAALGDKKVGAQIAVEYQATEDVSVGLALAGGTGLADENDTGPELWNSNEGPRPPPPRVNLLAARVFGQWNAGGLDRVATTFGVGAGVMTTGLKYVTFDGGEAVGYPNDTLVPHAALVAALAIPLASGEPFGAKWEPLKKELYVGGLVGLVAPIASSGNAISIEAGLLTSLTGRGGDGVFSLADSQSK